LYKKEVFVKGRKYSYYYHNIRSEGKIKNICLGSDLKKAREKLKELNQQDNPSNFFDFINFSNKKLIPIFIILLLISGFIFYYNVNEATYSMSQVFSSVFSLTGFAVLEDGRGNCVYFSPGNCQEINCNLSKDYCYETCDVDVCQPAEEVVEDIVAEESYGIQGVEDEGYDGFYGIRGVVDSDYVTNLVTINGTGNSSYENGGDWAQFGLYLDSGDINGDGYEDLVVSDYKQYASINVSAGQVYVFFGGPFILEGTNTSTANITISGTSEGEFLNADAFGSSLAVGDLNNDGFDDLIVGDLQHDIDQNYNTGKVFVFLGADYTTQLNVTSDTFANMTINGTIAGEYIGDDVAVADFNNDDYLDIITGGDGDNDFGNFRVFYGDDYSYPLHINSSSYNISIDGWQTNSNFGTTLAAGDINQDGFDDIITAAPATDFPGAQGNDWGQIFAFFGADIPSLDTDAYYANITINGTKYLEINFGHKSLESGDFNNDSYDDIIVGAPRSVDAHGDGAILIFFGANYTSPVNDNRYALANITINGSKTEAEAFGNGVAIADVNNDGIDDILYADYGADVPPGDTPNAVGQAGVFFGADYTTNFHINRSIYIFDNFTVNGSYDNSFFAYHVGACDINADGYPDMVIGSPFFEITGFPKAGQVEIAIYNPAPTTPNITLAPLDDVITQDLTCTATVNDSVGTTLTASIEWFKDNISQYVVSGLSATNNEDFVYVLDNANLSVGDEWGCGVAIDDGVFNSSWSNATQFTVIVNSVPLWEPIDDIEVDEDFANFTLDLSDNISDVEDADPDLGVSYVLNESDWIVEFDNSTDELIVSTFTPNATGSVNISLTLIDTDGSTAFESFDLVVSAVDDVPWANGSLMNITQLEDFGSVTAISNSDLNANFSDVEEDNAPYNP